MTEPLTAEQIAACRAVLDQLDGAPSDPFSDAIHARALARARAERVGTPVVPATQDPNRTEGEDHGH